MCTGHCSRVVGATLVALALLCIVANVLLAFPDWKTDYVRDWQRFLTPEVVYMGGLLGGGVVVLVPATQILATGGDGCCGNRCGMCLSVALAAMGAVGAVYSTAVSGLGLVNGPQCKFRDEGSWVWGQPFKNETYLLVQSRWAKCEEPRGVVQFNVILFSILTVASLAELAFCLTQVLNGLFGCLCGTCNKKETRN